MFFELPTELPPIEDNGKLVDPEALRKFDSRIAVLVLVGLAAAGFLLMIGVFTGVSLIVIFGSSLAFAAGLVGGAVVLDHGSKVRRLAEAYGTCHASLQSAAKANREIVSRYYAFKMNFDSIVKEAREAEEAKLAETVTAARNLSAMSQQNLLTAKEFREATNERLLVVIERFLDDTRKNIQSKLTVNNYGASRDRFLKAVEFCRKQGFELPQPKVDQFLAEIKEEFENLVRIQAKKEEQARIKERIREEERARAEIERELKRVATEREAIEKAIAEVLAKTQDEHSAEVEMLRAKLAEAEERSKRALSMAQQTKAGNVYVISNIGSFGESVFKIGMTRRLDPMDRVKELGDASVPFPFDVHMMIFSDDAPAMEAALHRKFNHERVNRVNLRKEFFRVQLDEVVTAVEELAGRVEYIADPEALEYRESQRMTDEDVDLIYASTGSELLDDDDN